MKPQLVSKMKMSIQVVLYICICTFLLKFNISYADVQIKPQTYITISYPELLYSVKLKDGKNIECLINGDIAAPGVSQRSRSRFIPSKIATEKQISNLKKSNSRANSIERKKIKKLITKAKRDLRDKTSACLERVLTNSLKIVTELPIFTNKSKFEIDYRVLDYPKRATFELKEGRNTLLITEPLLKKFSLGLETKIYLDTVAPTLKVISQIPAITTASQITVDFEVDQVRHTKIYTLRSGDNMISVEGKDLAGNLTAQTHRIFKQGGDGYLNEDFKFQVSGLSNVLSTQNIIWNDIGSIGAGHNSARQMPSSLVAYWGFNSDLPNLFTDDAVGLLKGEKSNSEKLKWLSEGFNGGSYRFIQNSNTANANGHLYISPKNLDPILTKQFTLAFWMKASDTNSLYDEFIIDHYNPVSQNGGFQLKDQGGHLTLLVRDAYTGTITLDTGILTKYSDSEKWVHIVITYDGNLLKAYKNGTLVWKSKNLPNLDISTNDSFVIGERRYANYRGFIGMLDEVMLFDKALTIDEIHHTYAVGVLYSKEIEVGYEINKLSATWSGDGPSPFVEISMDGGINWCGIENGGSLVEQRCYVSSSKFSYRVLFPSNTSTIDILNFTWQKNKLSVCGDGTDNDQDGRIDLIDPGCQDTDDNSEDAGRCEDSFSIYTSGAWEELETKLFPLKNHILLSGGSVTPEYTYSSLPQLANVYKGVDDIRKLGNVYDRSYDGIFIMDWENWEVSWDQIFEPEKRAEAIRYTKIKYPNLAEADLLKKAENEYNSAAKGFWLNSIAAFRATFPRAKLGFYGYPSRTVDWIYNPGLASKLRQDNDKLAWLWSSVDLIAPSVYQVYASAESEENYGSTFPAATNKILNQAWSSEAKRIGDKFGKPVYAYVWFVYHSNGGKPYGLKPLSDIDLQQMLTIPLEEGLDGLFLWNEEISYPVSELRKYINTKVAPMLQSLTKKRCKN